MKRHLYDLPMPAAWSKLVGNDHTDFARHALRSVVITTTEHSVALTITSWYLVSTKKKKGLVRTKLFQSLVFTLRSGRSTLYSIKSTKKGRMCANVTGRIGAAVWAQISIATEQVESRVGGSRELELPHPPNFIVTNPWAPTYPDLHRSELPYGENSRTIQGYIDRELAAEVIKLTGVEPLRTQEVEGDPTKERERYTSEIAIRDAIFPALVGTAIFQIPGCIVKEYRRSSVPDDPQRLAWSKIIPGYDIGALPVHMKALVDGLSTRQAATLKSFFRACPENQIDRLLTLEFKHMRDLYSFIKAMKKSSLKVFVAYRRLKLDLPFFANWYEVLDYFNQLGGRFAALQQKPTMEQVENIVLAAAPVEDFEQFGLSTERKAQIAAHRLGV